MKRTLLEALVVGALALGIGHVQAHSDKHKDKADDKSDRKSMDHDKMKKSGGGAKKGGGHEGKH